MEKKELEAYLEQLGIFSIELNKTSEDEYSYNKKEVELIEFTPEKIQFKEKFFDYLKYIKKIKDSSTVKNINSFTNFHNRYFFVLDNVSEDYCLANLYKNFSNHKKLLVSKQIADIIKYFHNEKDMSLHIISTNNIYFINNKVKFNVNCLEGVIKECQVSNYKKPYQQYKYFPPEQVDPLVVDENYNGKEGNIWSFGCVLSELFSYCVPWTNKGKIKDMIIIKNLIKKIDFPIPEILFKKYIKIARIVECCVNVKKEKRITINEVIDRINHIIVGKEKIYSLLLALNSNRKLKKLIKKNVTLEVFRFL